MPAYLGLSRPSNASAQRGRHMSKRTFRSGAVAGLLIAILLLSGAFVLLTTGSQPARAAVCDQGGSLITSDWTINTAQVCTGIVYTVDGSVTINSGGSLTLVNGGLSFAKDTSHTGYALTVNSGGSLTLQNSIVTTQTTAIQPYLKLALTVTGPSASFAMTSGSMLKFPGWVNATGATISMSNSVITGFTSGDILGTGLNVDENDDGPLISFASTTATLYGSRIERIFENTTTMPTGVDHNITLSTGSTFIAYDSFIGVDYSNVVGLHNELQVADTSNAYLYNVTIDRTQDPVSETNWQPAYVPQAGSSGGVYLLRWLHATIVDSTGFPVSGAAIWSALSPAQTTAQYPDNGMSTVPSQATLTYLNRAATGTNAWNMTDANGNAIIPLYTDLITTSSLPNALSFGNYQLGVTFSTYSTQGGVFFNPYPAVSTNDNNAYVTVGFSTLRIRTGPDLALRQSDYPNTQTVIAGQPFTFGVKVYNQGQTQATNFDLAAFLNGDRSAYVTGAKGLTLAAGGSMNVSLTGTVTLLGTQTLELAVNPNNTINEGGAAQLSNNFANLTLNVQPAPAGNIAIIGPDPGTVIAPGSPLTVSGVVRANDLTGIVGVTVTIQLLYNGNLIASNTTRSVANGYFVGTVNIPADATQGTYTISVTSTASVIQGDSRTISVAKPLSFFDTPVPFIGLAWWMFLIILAVIIAAFVGVTLYFKVYGLGKMVECGECGSFIPEDATRCPKCGVEFEKDMAKCSNCQAWVPADVKECPECGVEFATGQLDMTDYQQKMRLQYDEVVVKFRQEAQRQLGRQLSEGEFQDWWRKQPTFVTFEDWLRDEEDMRKMGSKPCPVCGTLNSVTAKVCHKCGSAMRDLSAASSTGATRVGAPRARVARQPAVPSDEGEGDSNRPTPPSAPVVQKRVVRMPTTDQTQDQSSDEKKGDEL